MFWKVVAAVGAADILGLAVIAVWLHIRIKRLEDRC